MDLIKWIEKKRITILIIIILLSIILRIGGLYLGEQIIGPHDTFAPIAGATNLIEGEGYQYYYLSSPGISILLLPFLFISKTLMSVKVALFFYSILFIVSIYFFVKKIYPKSSIPALISTLIMGINPTFFIYSIVILYDNIQALFIFLFLIATWIISEGTNKKINYAIYFILGVFLFLLKESNISFLLSSGLFLFLKDLRLNGIKKSFLSKKIFTTFLMILLIFLLYFGNQYTRERASNDIPSFFFSGNYKENLESTIEYLSNPLLTPNFSGIFRYTENSLGSIETLISVISIMLLIIGIIFILKEARRGALLMGLTTLANVLFFTIFLKWQLRYYFPSLAILIIIIAFGAYKLIIDLCKRDKIKGNFGAFILIFLILASLIAVATDLNVLGGLEKKEKREANYVLLNNNDVESSIKLINSSEKSVIYTSYGPWIDFYIKIEEKNNIEVIDTYRIVYYSYSMESATKEIKEKIEKDRESGKKTYYLVGWQEFFKENRDTTRNFNLLWESIKNEFEIEVLYEGDNAICESLLGRKCFELVEIRNK